MYFDISTSYLLTALLAFSLDLRKIFAILASADFNTSMRYSEFPVYKH